MITKIISLFKKLIPIYKWPKWIHRIRLSRIYKRHFGKNINWKNPSSFTEKMNWYMVYFTDEIATRITDKVQFKDYVEDKIGSGYTSKLLRVWNSIDDVDFSSLKPPYVIKSNCSGDGNNIIVIKDEIFDTNGLLREIEKWFHWENTFINGSSNAYHKIKPLVFVEEYIEGLDGYVIDYKFYCFDGKPYCAYTSYGGFVNGVSAPKESKFAFYDMEWNDLNISYDGRGIFRVEKPIHFDQMVQIAAKLSKGFPFVRVDFYDLPDRLLVGEMTYDSSWGEKSFSPESFDYELGSQFVISRNKLE